MKFLQKLNPFSRDNHKILFLDFDGVLNAYGKAFGVKQNDPVPAWAIDAAWTFGWIDRDKAARLLPLLADEDFRIVISSSWRSLWDIPHLKRILNGAAQGLGDRIIDVTPQRGFRGQEIDAWIGLTKFKGRYAILDDDRSMLAYQHPFFVNTNMYRGVTDADVRKVKLLLDIGDLKQAA